MKNQHIVDRINNRKDDSQDEACILLAAFLVICVVFGIIGFVLSLQP